jgi:hypothetical protein
MSCSKNIPLSNKPESSRPIKKPYTSQRSDTSEDIFDFFQDDNTESPKSQPSKKETKENLEQLPHIDLTENPAYLLQFCNNGFVWNEEVLLSPPFYASSFHSNSSSSYPSRSSSSYENRIFPTLLAEKLRKQRIAQETYVAEIRID